MRVLIYATRPDAKKGLTGATLGTRIVHNQLSSRCDVETIALNSYGIDSLGAVGHFAFLRRALGAAQATLGSWLKLCIRGLQGPKIDCVYYLPAASLGGALRDAGFTVLLRLFFRKARIIQHVRNGNYFEGERGLRAHLRRFSTRRTFRIFVLSDRLLPDWCKADGELQERLFVLPNTIDAALIPPADHKVLHRPKLDRLSILYFSNYIATKGYNDLLTAAILLGDRGLGDRIHVTFRGAFPNPELRSDFLERVKAIPHKDLSIDAGDAVADRSEARALYASHDVFCLPTNYPAEAQPRSILEAMANGCAIIATKWRSIPDLVIPGETGILIDQREPEALADAIEACLSGNLDAMRAASRERFEQRFSPISIERKLHEGFGL